MISVCCFDGVISIVLFLVDRVSCLSRNVSLILQVWRGPPSIELWHVSDKQNTKKYKPHLFLNTQGCCQNYIICNYFHPVFPI